MNTSRVVETRGRHTNLLRNRAKRRPIYLLCGSFKKNPTFHAFRFTRVVVPAVCTLKV
jgi:hypothetical protein